MSIKSHPFTLINSLATVLHDHMTHYGYLAVETPVIEAAELFITRAGDQIVNRLFTFERYGQQLALRPEFTAAAAHYYALMDSQDVARWQFYGTIFADDPNDYHHDYQQLSMGAELIGLAGPAADAEIIGMALQGIRDITPCHLTIGHVGLMRHLLSHHQLDPRTERFLINNIPQLQAHGVAHVLERFEEVLQNPSTQIDTSANEEIAAKDTHNLLDALLDATQRGTTMGGRTRQDIAQRLLQKRRRATERTQVVAALEFLNTWIRLKLSPAEMISEIMRFVPTGDTVALQYIENLQSTLDILSIYGIPEDCITIRTDLSPNWDYYTGIVFEISSQDGHKLGGGGRYDELVSLVGRQQAIPAVGFAYYLDAVLVYLQSDENLAPQPVVIPLNHDNQVTASALAEKLRQQAITVILLPQTAHHTNKAIVTVTAEGLIQHGPVTYQPNQVDDFIADFKQAYYG